jgi:hypothetical protein
VLGMRRAPESAEGPVGVLEVARSAGQGIGRAALSVEAPERR